MGIPKGSHNDPTVNPSLSNMLHKSVIIHSNIIISQDGRVQSYCGLKLKERDVAGSGASSLPASTGIDLTQKATASTSKYAFTRSKRRSAGPAHIRTAKKNPQSSSSRVCSTDIFLQGVPVAYHNLGPPSYQFRSYHANMWYEERNDKSKRAVNPTFSFCCQEGKVLLSRFSEAPPPLNRLLDYNDPTTSRFRDQIRVYNSMFCFTSFGARIDHSINTGRGLYIFKINGQNYHRIRSPLPKQGAQPRYAQLYFFDTQNEVRNRMSAFMDKETGEGVDENIVTSLIQMLDQSSSIAKAFRMARDWFHSHNSVKFELHLLSDRTTSRQYNAPTVLEVAALITNDFGGGIPTRDIIQRNNQGTTLLRGGCLFQQYLVDAYTAIEEQRLKWTRNNQETLRVDLYHNMCDAVTRGDTSAAGLGKRIVLPRSFTGSPRYMMQNYQDAMALCRAYGNPDLFITFTYNPKWPEISEMMTYVPGQKAHDRPEVGTRVFKMKLTEMLDDFTKKQIFGDCRAVVYVIEFQKRGLPHEHILLWLEERYKCRTPGEIDDIISAEIPSPIHDPDGYKIVTEYILYGPCGKDAKYDPCTAEGKYVAKNHECKCTLSFTSNKVISRVSFPRGLAKIGKYQN
ncbi:hypothetical protein OROHE_020602 [Orobanche hederae]